MKAAITLTAVFLLTVVSFFSQSVNAQVAEDWVKQYNGSADGSDFSSSIITDHAGNSYLTGFVDSMGVADIITIKYSPAGTMLWSKRYNGPASGSDRGVMVKLDDSGNVFVAGSSTGAGTFTDIVTIKYGPTGILKWVARYDGPMHMDEFATAISVDPSGSVYVCGSGPSVPSEGFDFVTIKYSPTGGMDWVRYCDRPGFGGGEHPTAMATHGGAVYVTGFSLMPGFPDYIITVGYSASGDTLFTTPYDGSGAGGRKSNSIAVTPTGEIYVCGFDYSGSSTAGVDYVTIKYAPSGAILWAKKYNGTSSAYDEATKVVVDGMGFAYVTGYSAGVSSLNDYVTIKYSGTGDSLWVKRYNNSESGDDIASDIKVGPSGSVYVTGWSRDSGIRYDFLTVKYSGAGAHLWDIRYNATHATIDSKPIGLGLDGAGNVFVTGYSNGPTGNEDITTIKYKEVMTGVTGNTNSTPKDFELKQNYPNPFNPSTKISFSIPTAGMTTLKVYDMVGKEVAQLVNGNINAGSHEFNFDSKGLSSGVYFYTLQSGDFVETKKMNLIK